MQGKSIAKIVDYAKCQLHHKKFSLQKFKYN
jgi:hypothetical protein